MTTKESLPPVKEKLDPQALLLALEEAKHIIWKRIQAGEWRNEDEAIAGIKIYQHLIKALQDTEHLSQLPLPYFEEDKEKL